MAYSRFVPGFSRHMKRIKCGPVSSWLWACSVDHCTQYETDGFLDERAIPGLCAQIVGGNLKRAVDNLVAVGSWERVDGGYLVHNYTKHNLSKAQVAGDREASRQRYLSHRARSHAVTTPETTPETQPVSQPLDGPLTPVSQPLSRLCRADVRQSGSQSSSTPTTSKGPIAPATGPNDLEEHRHKKREALAMLKRTFPDLPPPGESP